MIIKCKMCGGDIRFTPGDTYGTCECCGSTSTIPKADDETKLNRYNRANDFRRQCEFDKALVAYKKMLEQDDTDAEAHWGAVLSRYGIEYVEDPTSKQRIPTCHRMQVTSILADDDYFAAVRYAPDAKSRRLYEQQAAQIAEIQKGIPSDADQKASYAGYAKEAQQLRIYTQACELQKKADDDARHLDQAIQLFESIPNYRDANARIEQCREKKEDERQRETAAAAKRKKIAFIGAAAVVVAIAVVLLVTQVIIPAGNYKQAIALRTAGQYDEAVAALKEMGDYKDAAAQIPATYYAKGEALLAAGEYASAVTAFINAGDYSDAADQITEAKYRKAQSLYAAGDYVNACATYMGISGYKDVDNLLATDDNLIAAAAEVATASAAHDAEFTVGNYVEFGTYPQTSNGDDTTAIEWLVLARDGNNALLLSRYGLDAQPYNEEWEDITWEKCTLRTWLNDTFINKAFTDEEQSAILLTNVDNSQA